MYVVYNMDVDAVLAGRQGQFRTTEVEKEVELQFDLGNLLATDLNAVDTDALRWVLHVLEVMVCFWKNCVVSGLQFTLQCFPIVVQGVVTYMSRVEAFATGIKTESSNQSPLGGDQGIKVTSELLKINNQEHAAAIWPLTLENQAIKSLIRRDDQVIKHTICWSKNLIAVANASIGDI